MALDIPLPTATPTDDPLQYIPLLLSAIGEFLQAKDVWAAADYDDAYGYMEDLKDYVVDLFTKGRVMNVGLIDMWLDSAIPDGWLLLDGSDVSRTTYADLFALWGTNFGLGDGSTTFGLPDMGGRSPMGVGSTVSLGDLAGAASVTLTTANLPSHSHAVTDSGHVHRERVGNGANAFILGSGGGSNPTVGSGLTTNTAIMETGSSTTGISIGNTGSGSSHNNVHPVRGVHFIVWTGVL